TAALARIAVGHALRETAGTVMPLPPFACLQTYISLFPEQARKRGHLRDAFHHPAAQAQVVWIPRQLGRFLAGRFGRVVAGDLALMRIQACEAGSKAGAAPA